MIFAKAVKYESKGRVALIGPSGAGKSYTMLVLARLLAGPTGKIAAVDTEHGSLSKYADLFEFDVIEPDSYKPEVFMESLKSAEDGGYAVLCCDSLSHFWMGKDGALEWVDMAKRRSSSRDDMAGWKDFSPVERRMVDAMISSPCHVICTMRTKTEYQEQINERTGKKQRVKIGLAPVQRQGLEYEFDLIGYMDDENTFITDKTRCPEYTQKAIVKPKAKDFEAFSKWLKGSERPPIAVRTGTADSAMAVAEVKLNGMHNGESYREASSRVSADISENGDLSGQLAESVRQAETTKHYKMLEGFQNIKKELGDVEYYRILGENGFEKSNQITDLKDGRRIYKAMGARLAEIRDEAAQAQEAALGV